MDITINFTNNSGDAIDEMIKKNERALKRCGLLGEKYAKMNLKKFPRVDTGWLRNNVTHAVTSDAAYIGTNVEYAIYVEVGTGIHAADGQGRKTPWHYQDDKGNWHTTRGIKPSHFLKRAVSEHVTEYRDIIDKTTRG